MSDETEEITAEDYFAVIRRAESAEEDLLIAENELRLITVAADALVANDGHDHTCRFAGCTCGSIESYKAARTEYRRVRGAIQ